MESPLPVPTSIGEPTVCTVPTASAAVTVVKTESSTGPYTCKDVITYNLEVTNTSSVVLQDVVITDSLSAITITSDPLGLASGSGACINAGWTTNIQYTYVVTDDDVTNGFVLNTATLSSSVLTAADTLQINDIIQPPVLAFSKIETSTGPYTEGYTITYQVSVTNTGGSNANILSLTDTLQPNITITSDVSGLFAAPFALPGGSSAIATYDYVVTAGDVTTGVVSNSACITSTLSTICDDIDITNIGAPGQLSATKTQQTLSGTYGAGDTITYSVDVLNLGGVDVDNVLFTDTLSNITITSDISALSAGTTTLGPSATAQVVYDYIITPQDVANGSIDNTAIFTSSVDTVSSNTVSITSLSGEQFIFTIDTSLDASPETFELPLISSDSNYDFYIEWGDGSGDSITAWDQAEKTHTYASSGVYTLTATGTIQGWRFNNTGDKLKFVDVVEWTALDISTPYAFWGCANFTGSLTAVGVPKITSTNLSLCFYDCNSFNGRVDEWDVSGVTGLNGMFKRCFAFNNGGVNALSSWDVSSATTLRDTFECDISPYGVFNQNLNSWDISNVTSLFRTFGGQLLYDQPLDEWADRLTGNLTNMFYTFYRCQSFNQPLSSWGPKLSSVNDMRGCFQNTAVFNQPIDNWDVSNVTTMNAMFQLAGAFVYPISSWDIRNVTSMENMFRLNNTYNTPLCSWGPKLSSVTNMKKMFNESTYNHYMGDWDVSNVTNMDSMFLNAFSFNQSLCSWNIENVTNMTNMLSTTVGLAMAFSQTNYDQLLTSWSALSVTPGVPFAVKKTRSSASQTGFDTLTSAPNNWVIRDLGLV